MVMLWCDTSGFRYVLKLACRLQLSGLQHIHSDGIVHRDIKPENLLCSLDDESTLKTIDFGIAKPLFWFSPQQI